MDKCTSEQLDPNGLRECILKQGHTGDHKFSSKIKPIEESEWFSNPPKKYVTFCNVLQQSVVLNWTDNKCICGEEILGVPA